MNFSKSKYCALWQCPKMAWLRKYKPEEFELDTSSEVRFENGNEVGELAKGLFGSYDDATVTNSDGSLDLLAMINRTKWLINSGAESICEAAFDHDGLYCAVDILHKEKDGYAIYEVKSSTHVKHIYLVDVAYQKYVLQKCGIKVTGAYIVNINSDYIFDGSLDIHRLFKINDVFPRISDEEAEIENNLLCADKLLASQEEPQIDISERCREPYGCGFWNYCTKHIPSPSVFDLYKLQAKKKFEFYNDGIITFDELRECGKLKDERQLRQIEYALEDKGLYVDKIGIRQFLDKLTYPLYFLDFETMQLAIPQFEGTKPYQQIPFQYSLHYIEREDGEVKHKEFLGTSGEDPRRALAVKLTEDIPQGACVLVYNKAFECARIKELAHAYGDLSSKLLTIQSNIIDLLEPFQKGYCYNRAMCGSFSIKSVLPALFPDDPRLNYHNLDGVHNGSEAMDIFPRIKNMPSDEAEKARRDLLKYCELDTFAMVKVLQALIKICIP